MPCYHFSWHAYGTWASDAPRPAAVGRQLLLADQVVVERYRDRRADPAECLDDAAQRMLIEELQDAVQRHGLRLHAVATDSSGVQAAISWRDDRGPDGVRRGLHDALAARLNAGPDRTWLSHRGRRRRIENRAHLQHVVDRVLAWLAGWKWDERRGLHH